MRGTLPRFRYDQLMSFGWKLLLPVSLANLVITAFVISFAAEARMSLPFILFFACALLAVAGAVMLILGARADSQRACADSGDDVARRAVPAAGRGIHRRRADHRLCRRDHGAVRLRHHAAERWAWKSAPISAKSPNSWACRWRFSCCSTSRTGFRIRRIGTVDRQRRRRAVDACVHTTIFRWRFSSSICSRLRRLRS